MNKLTQNRRYMLNGYMALLREAMGNGRTNHDVAQCITGLQGYLRLDSDISSQYEERIKNMIRRHERETSAKYRTA